MFLPPVVGTRTLVGGSATLLLLPMVGWVLAVRDPGTSYTVLLLLAAASGVGGGAFAGFMPSTSYFFPRRMAGTALGLQAGIGNFGVSLIQLLVPWVVGFGLLGTAALTPQQRADGSSIWLHNAGLVLIPWVLLGMVLAAVWLRRVPVTANFRQQLDIFNEKHTWYMTAVYLMTFGAFSGFAAQLGLLIKNMYEGMEGAPDPLKYVFLGPLLGSITRAAWGPLCDRYGGAVWSLVAGIGMTAATVFTAFFLAPTDTSTFGLFLGGMLAIFTFAGIGNAGTFKQMPMIFERRRAGGVIGFTSAIAAFGPFLVGVGLSLVAPQAFFIGAAVYFALCTAPGVAPVRPPRRTPPQLKEAVVTARTDKPGTDNAAVDALLSLGSRLRPGTMSPDKRALFLEGGREGDAFYRDRWSHDKVVRSTHGVNCTGSCSWKVYVKDGIITWETQQTDYPSVGPDSPEYEPRGCPRGAAFSWYTYSPTRVRYPYVRGALLRAYRAAKERTGDPVLAWAEVTGDPETARSYKSARGKGGLIRATWDEASEIVAAAHVHTIKTYGPDRVAGFSPIPAMSMVSHGSGARFVSMLGGTMLSFYDWYADLPVASPQVFGDQTDVPESADWWNASYLMMWGSNVPVTRTPDAHFMTEARYRGQKVVTVSPDYADNTKFADEWLAPHPGTDGALATAMGHVILREFLVERRTARFAEYMSTFTDATHLVTLRQRGDAWVPDKFLTADALDGPVAGPDGIPRDTHGRDAAFMTVVLDADGSPRVPNGTLGHRFDPAQAGSWNLDLGTIRPVLSVADLDTHDGTAVAVDLPRFDVAADGPDGEHTGGAGVVRRGVPVTRIGDALVTTVFDLLLAQYGVGRDGLPGTWPTGYDDPSTPGTPAWQEEITGVPAAAAERIGREFAENAEASGGRSMILMGAGTNHWFHSDTIYRTFLALVTMTGCQGVNGGGWAHYVGQEKCRPVTGWAQYAFGLDWVRPPRQMIGTAFWYLATDQWRYDGLPADALASPLAEGLFAGRTTADCLVESAKRGWMPSYPTFNRNPLELVDEARAAGKDPAAHVVDELREGRLKFAVEDPDDPVNFPRVLTVWRANILGSSGKGNEYFLRHLLGTDSAVMAEESGPGPSPEHDDLARRGAARQARPARHQRLPHDVDDAVLRRRAARGDLVREARPVDDGHAPVRALVQPGHRPAVADPHGLRHLRHAREGGLDARRRAPRQARGPRRRAAHARHPGRDDHPARHRHGASRT